MEARSYIKHVRISPIKLRFIVDNVKAMDPQTALDHLSVSKNRTAKVLYKAIKSAVDNGVQNHGMSSKNMKFSEIMINEGRFLKRFRAGSRGMGKPYLRRSSHIMVTVEQDLPTKPVKKTKKVEKKVEVKKSASADKTKAKASTKKKTTVKNTKTKA